MTQQNVIREKWIDNAKGIAIILVILAHVSDAWNFAYGFHLVVFFVLSGYTLKRKDVSTQLLSDKFGRLMTPYFYTCFAIIITDVVNSYIINHDATIATTTGIMARDLIRTFFASGDITKFGTIELGTRIGAIWFLPAMFFAIIIMQLLLQYIKSDLSLGLASVGISITGAVSAAYIWLPFSVQSGMFATPFIFLGYYIKKHASLDRVRVWYYPIALALVVVGFKLGYCGIGFVRAAINDFIISPIVGVSGCLIVFGVAKYCKGNLIGYIGKMSLTVLCVHLYSLETMWVYINYFLDKTGMDGTLRSIAICLIYVLFAIVGAEIIERIKKWYKQREIVVSTDNNGRNRTIDIVKGILIISMVFAHYQIDGTLRSIVFSCHMIAFVLLSGYCYKPNVTLLSAIKRMVKTFLAPYAIAVVIVIVISHNVWSISFFKEIFVRYLLGLSFARQFFIDVGSVGPIYFILLLFIVRIMYIVIDRFVNTEYMKWAIVLMISLAGVYLGNKGYWLPWSFDVSCYCLIFYKVGVFIKDKDLLFKLENKKWLYFLLSPIWAFMIFSGSMEIAVRNYGSYGLAVTGAICGVLVVCLLAKYIDTNLFYVGSVLSLCGRSSIYILVVHTTIGGTIGNCISGLANPSGFLYLVTGLTVQVGLAICVYWCIYRLPLKRRYNHL